MNKYSLFLVVFFHLLKASDLPLPVDVSFLVADLRYNEEQGVKLCEIQQGNLCLFQGFDFIENRKGVLGERLCSLLSKYHHKFWFISKDVNFNPMIPIFLQNHWMSIRTLRELKQKKTFQLLDQHLINHYRGILYASLKSVDNLRTFKLHYPDVIPINASNLGYWNDKLLMSELFRGHEVLENIKPKWNHYPKTYSEELSRKIIEEIDSDLLVIKPRCFAEGKGVILLTKEDLDQTLSIILGDRVKLSKMTDPGYRFWALDKKESFLVEEYVPSAPVYVPHFSNLPYNGTMRIVFVMTYDNQRADVHFLGGYWILPEKSLIETGTFNEKNKSCPHPPHYCEIDADILHKVEEQLRPAMLLMYERMLGISSLAINSFAKSTLDFDLHRTQTESLHPIGR